MKVSIETAGVWSKDLATSTSAIVEELTTAERRQYDRLNRNSLMTVFWWLTAIVLMAIGLIGTVVPVIPGTTIILGAAVIHRLVLGANGSVGWTALVALVALTLVTYAVDAAAGYVGARKFGATKWGLIGGATGALIGLFFGLVGLFVAPVIGAIAGEIVGGQRMVKAGRAGWGTFVGALAAIIAKLFIALIMIAIFLMNVPSPL